LHISEGVLSPPVLAAGAALAAGGVAMGLRQLDEERIPRVAVLSSAFFVASLIHVPIFPSSAHLILNGLAGILLGWAAFPALLIALLLQAVLFGFGGLTALGVNTVVMATPAVICRYLFGWALRRGGPGLAFCCGFGAAAAAILLSTALLGLALLTTGREFLEVFALVAVAHLPVAAVEGLVTGSVAAFLWKVKPDLLGARTPRASGSLRHA
jgi:cobalt/nickel transport system permease protein